MSCPLAGEVATSTVNRPVSSRSFFSTGVVPFQSWPFWPSTISALYGAPKAAAAIAIQHPKAARPPILRNIVRPSVDPFIPVDTAAHSRRQSNAAPPPPKDTPPWRCCPAFGQHVSRFPGYVAPGCRTWSTTFADSEVRRRGSRVWPTSFTLSDIRERPFPVTVHGAGRKGTGPCFRPTSFERRRVIRPKNGPVPRRPVNGYPFPHKSGDESASFRLRVWRGSPDPAETPDRMSPESGQPFIPAGCVVLSSVQHLFLPVRVPRPQTQLHCPSDAPRRNPKIGPPVVASMQVVVLQPTPLRVCTCTVPLLSIRSHFVVRRRSTLILGRRLPRFE